MDKAELREIFGHFDLDSNGHIDRNEFKRLMQEGLRAGMTQDELDVGFSVIDADDNGTIEFREFVAWWEDR